MHALPAGAARPKEGRCVTDPLPPGFSVGHWSDPDAATGCTVVLPGPEGATASVDIRGGGTGTRETQLLDPLANPQRVHAVLLTGGSAFGLAAADGVVRWLERQGRGHPTPAGLVPLVPGAVLYDLSSGDPAVRPGPDQGEAACEAATANPQLGSVGAGTGAAVGKILGREASVKGGVGVAAQELPAGGQMAVLAVVNASGDVIGEDGAVLAGARRDGAFVGTTDLLRTEPFELPKPPAGPIEGNTTLVCVMTDATLDKTGCAIVAKMASAGVARAVDPVHSAIDGDVVFTLACGEAAAVDPLIAGVVAAALTAEAIRDACRRATGLAGIPALQEL
jgi:L-aminopeptidase/D-esterase-like protein